MIDWNEHLYYDETSASCLRWKTDRMSGRHYAIVQKAAGEVAGTLHPSMYYYVSFGNRRFPAHKIVFEMHGNVVSEGNIVDHFDRDSTNNRYGNLREIVWEKNSKNRNKSTLNTSGVTGVAMDEKVPGVFYWKAYWSTLEKKRKSKSFRIDIYGNDEAFLLACEYRAKMIEELNEQGAGYTERHGT